MSVGISVDPAKLKSLLGELKGKDIHEVICAGREKMASVPTGAVAVAGGGGAGGGGAAEPAVEEKAEEPEEEEEEDEVGNARSNAENTCPLSPRIWDSHSSTRAYLPDQHLTTLCGTVLYSQCLC